MSDFLTTPQVVARLRMIRRKRGMSAQTVAKLSGIIGRSALASLETGVRKDITWDELRLLSEVLDVDPRDVVFRDGPELCATCHDSPAAGFTCNNCGTSTPAAQ